MPTAKVEVELVDDRRTHRAFREFPYRLYRDHPVWVPPLRGEEDDRWSAKRNASLASRWSRRFVARRAGEVVGRIAATTDPAFQARWQRNAGFFGFFECVRDPDVACTLCSAAETALLARGVDSVLGPVNLSTHDEVGLLVDGFDAAPTLLTSYHPPHYAGLLEGAGYHGGLDYFAYRWDPLETPAPSIDRLLRASSHDRGSGRLTLRSSRPRQWVADNRTIFDLYNRAFEGLWGFVPLSWDEYRQRADRFRPFYEPQLVVIAEWEGRPVGFAVALPDINQALTHARGRLWPIGWWRIMRRARAIRSVRLMLLGVLPEYVGRGIGALLAHEVAAAARRLGVHAGEISLVQATNHRIRRVIDAFKGRHSKTYRLYQKVLRS